MATIKDVAREAGVSVGTVSNIINKKSSLRNENYHKVMEAIQKLNYHANFAARNLRNNRQKLIGVILPKLNAFYSDIYSGISHTFSATNYYAILKLSEDDPLLESSLIESFIQMGVNAICMVPTYTAQDCSRYERLKETDIPVVLIEHDIEGLSCDKILFQTTPLLLDTIHLIREHAADGEIGLIRLDMDYTSELSLEKEFLHQERNGRVFLVGSHRSEMFSGLLRAFSGLERPLKALITRNFDMGLAAQDVCQVLGWDTEIYSFCGNTWTLADAWKKIHPMPLQAYKSGVTAGTTIREIFEQPDGHFAETKMIGKMILGKEYLPVMTDASPVIRILCLNSPGTDAIEQLSVRLSDMYSIRFDFDKKNYVELKSAVKKEIAGGSEYDLIMIDKPWIEACLQSRHFMNLGNEFAAEIFLHYPSFILRSFFENQFRPFFVPFIAGVQTMLYRVDVFQDGDIQDAWYREHGTPLSVPATWGSYLETASFFTGFQSAKYHFPYGTLVYSKDPIGLVSEFYPRQWAYNGSVYDGHGHACLDTPANNRALKNLCDTCRCSDPLLMGQMSNENVADALLAGRIPMGICFTNHYHPSRTSEPTFENFIKMAPLPKNRAMVGGYLLGISRHTKQPETCREFLKWIMSDHISICNMRMQGFIPTNAVYQNPYLTAQNPWLHLLEEHAQQRVTRETARDKLGNDITPETLDAVLTAAIRRTLSGSGTKDSLAEAEKELNRILQARYSM